MGSGFLHLSIGKLKGIFDNKALIIIILAALFSLIVDAPSLREQGFIKELHILKAISYFYMAFVIIIFIFLKMI